MRGLLCNICKTRDCQIVTPFKNPDDTLRVQHVCKVCLVLGQSPFKKKGDFEIAQEGHAVTKNLAGMTCPYPCREARTRRCSGHPMSLFYDETEDNLEKPA